MRRLAFLAVMSGCSACDNPWPAGTDLHVEAADGTRDVSVWRDQVRVAIGLWNVRLADCPVPYALLDAPSASSRAVRLESDANWDGPSGSTGYWDDDGAIHVMNKPNATYVIYTAAHELGHAMSGGEHSDDPADLMALHGASQITERDIRRMRSALGCP